MSIKLIEGITFGSLINAIWGYLLYQTHDLEVFVDASIGWLWMGVLGVCFLLKIQEDGS